MEASQSLVRLRSSADLSAITELEDALLTGELNAEVLSNPVEQQRQIIAQLLNAETDDELENFGNAIGWRELLEVPIEIRNFRWLPSTYDEGPAVFMVVQGTRLDTGESVVLTIGGANVMAQLANLAKRGRLVGAIRELTEGTKTRQGFTPLWLRTPEGVKAAAAASEPEA
jgi:hypothetical protein